MGVYRDFGKKHLAGASASLDAAAIETDVSAKESFCDVARQGVETVVGNPNAPLGLSSTAPTAIEAARRDELKGLQERISTTCGPAAPKP